MKNTGFEETVVINGVKMSLKEYKKSIKSKMTPKKKEKKEKTVFSEMSDTIKKVIREAKVIKSLAAYYDNGCRQWGHKVEEIIFNNKYIKKPFGSFRVSTRELMRLVSEIEKMSSKKDSCIFEYVDSLRYKMMDIEEEMVKLNKAITMSDVCDTYQHEKFINERGRRLGLKTLLINANIAVYKLKDAILNIESMEREAEMSVEYDPYTLRRYN